MSNKVILTNYKDKILLARFIQDKMDYLSFFDKNEISIGTIYLCRVTKVLDNIDGAFIQYGKRSNGFIKGRGYKCEQILPLQLKKEGEGGKAPVFTEKLSITTPYAVVSLNTPGVSVSSKLRDDERLKLNDALISIADELGIHIIARTNAAYTNITDVIENIRDAALTLKRIEAIKDSRTLYSELYKPFNPVIKEILDFNINSFDEIVTDIDFLYEDLLTQSAENNPFIDKTKIKFYQDNMLSLYHLYKMDHNIKNATDRRIPLKSGAEIVIDVTEALISIDVNTHNCKYNGDKEDTFLKTNKEAALEILRQLKIRNLSGMIIIDFINMELDKNYQELFDLLTQKSKEDWSSLKVIDITKLKLFELVRSKKRNTLYEQMR